LLRIGIWVMLSSTTETVMAKPLISVRLEQDLADRLKDQAEKDRRTVSSYVRNLIADTLPAQPVINQPGAR
jgi:predicted transcriptional regulator